jgi:hypothetical protein
MTFSESIAVHIDSPIAAAPLLHIESLVPEVESPRAGCSLSHPSAWCGSACAPIDNENA